MLLWDYGYSPSFRRSLPFETMDNISTLKACSNLIIDDAFKVAPNLFSQLLTAHDVTPDSYRMPLVYELLPGKRQTHYFNLLTELNRYSFVSR